MKVAALFPGQGSQFVGMGADLFESYPEARQLYQQADQALGFELTRISFQGPEEELRLTYNAQPAILCLSYILYRLLEIPQESIVCSAGHSLGEYTAVLCAGGFDFEDALKIVRLRGELMQQAVPAGSGAMAAIIGVDEMTVEDACNRASDRCRQVVVPANFNAPNHVVISGNVMAVDAASDELKGKGARVIPLKVSAPFHSPLMAPMVDRFSEALDGLNINNLSYPVINNVAVHKVCEAWDVRSSLIAQLDSPVQWKKCMEYMLKLEPDIFIEIGPGQTLAGLLKRLNRRANVLCVSDVGTLEKARQVLSQDRL